MPRRTKAEPSEGPWALEDYDGDYALVDVDGTRICVIPASRYLDGRRDPTQEANAQLILRAVNDALTRSAAVSA